jgi:FkbM family methyltransferase
MDKIEETLLLIGKNDEVRKKFIEFVKFAEQNIKYDGSIRDNLTKYLVDAIFEKNDTIIKKTSNGIQYKFLSGVGSKVAREFILSNPEIPEYAWEPQTTRLLLYLAENKSNVVIGGAYFGDQAIPIAKLIQKSNGKVHAFDLNQKQISILEENAKLNDLNNIESVNLGLWSDSSTKLNLSETDDLAFATPAITNDFPSNTISIDEYVSKHNLSGVDLIMLDIEGSEYNVLKGAENQLKKDTGYPNIVFEIHNSYLNWDNGLKNTDILQLLYSNGYKVYSIRDFQGNYDMRGKSIELILPEDTIIEGPKHGFNMLAIKDESIIKSDLFTFCKNVSPKYIIHKDPSIHHHLSGF